MSLEPTRELVLRKLHECFPDPDAAAEALAALDTYGAEPWQRERERVQLAVLKQPGGRLDALRRFLELAKSDYRDALVGAEYPEQIKLKPGMAPEHEIQAARDRDRRQYEA